MVNPCPFTKFSIDDVYFVDMAIPVGGNSLLHGLLRVRLIRAEPQVLKFTLIEAVNLTPLI